MSMLLGYSTELSLADIVGDLQCACGPHWLTKGDGERFAIRQTSPNVNTAVVILVTMPTHIQRVPSYFNLPHVSSNRTASTQLPSPPPSPAAPRSARVIPFADSSVQSASGHSLSTKSRRLLAAPSATSSHDRSPSTFISCVLDAVCHRRAVRIVRWLIAAQFCVQEPAPNPRDRGRIIAQPTDQFQYLRPADSASCHDQRSWRRESSTVR
jgi:hypothetical protein